MRSRILIGLIVGTIGGFVGWLLQENLIHYGVTQNVLTGVVSSDPLSAEQNRTLIFCVGGMIGLSLGMVEGLLEGSLRKLAIGLALGAFTGIVFGYVGFQFGGQVFAWLGGTGTTGHDPGLGGFARQVIARSFGWAMLGLGLGFGGALPTRSMERIRNGAIGGFLGGFIGGFIFDQAARLATPIHDSIAGVGIHEAGGPSRAIGFTVIGGLTGFFIGLIDELFKSAWVKVLAGRNEGKDIILSKAVSLLGRDERCDVPLYGDASIGAQHAAIRADGRRHVLIDGGSPVGTVVNGQKLGAGAELLLRDGDMIQIGSQRVLFREKETQNRVGAAPVDTPRGKANGSLSAPIPSHLCPFCGGAKDASGNCLCAPVAATGYSSGGGFGSPGSGMDSGFNGINPAFSSGSANAGGMVAPGTAAGRLVGVEGASIGQVFALSGANMLLGREAGRDIVVIGDSTISRTHARLANENGIFVVYDNSSANGTFVNGSRVSVQTLVPGDIVQFGASKFRFE